MGGTTATLQSATDDDGIALPAGRYFFTLDGSNSNKEHLSCDLSSTALTNIKSVSRQGVESSGVARAHRIGTTVALTDFAHIKFINDLVAGTTTFNASVPLGYDGTATISTANQLATKAYADALAIAGAPNADTTTKGIVEEATQAEVDAKTATGGTGAKLFQNLSTQRTVLTHDYIASAVGTDTYAITCVPAVTAYTTGDVYYFKADVANTGACTLNVNALGAKTLVTNTGLTPRDNYLKAGSLVHCQYDGTNMQILSVSGQSQVSQDGLEIYADDAGSNDTYVITLSPIPAAYSTGMVVQFKANTANTGACTLNVNSLGAKTIKKEVSLDLADNDILASQLVSVIYDGTNFQLISPIATKASGGSLTLSATGTTTITTNFRIKSVRVSALAGGSGGVPSVSNGSYDATTATNQCVYSTYNSNGAAISVNIDTSNCLGTNYGTNQTTSTALINNITATGFNIVFTKGTSNNSLVVWEAIG